MPPRTHLRGHGAACARAGPGRAGLCGAGAGAGWGTGAVTGAVPSRAGGPALSAVLLCRAAGAGPPAPVCAAARPATARPEAAGMGARR